MTELTTKTSTAEISTGSQSDRMGTMRTSLGELSGTHGSISPPVRDFNGIETQPAEAGRRGALPGIALKPGMHRRVGKISVGSAGRLRPGLP